MTATEPAVTKPSPVSLCIPENAWRPCGDPEEPGGERAVLSAVLSGPGGVYFYATALQVDPTRELQFALQWDSDLECIRQIAGASGPLATIEIAGRPYVVSVTPEEC